MHIHIMEVQKCYDTRGGNFSASFKEIQMDFQHILSHLFWGLFVSSVNI